MASFPLKKTLHTFGVYETPLIEAGAVPKFLEQFTRLQWLHLASSNRVRPSHTAVHPPFFEIARRKRWINHPQPSSTDDSLCRHAASVCCVCVRARARACVHVQAGKLDGFDWSGLKLLEWMYLTSNKLLGGVFPKPSSANLLHYHVAETAFEGALPDLAQFPKLTEVHIYNTPNAALGPMPLWLSTKTLPDILKTKRGSGVYGLIIDKAQRTGVKDANACAKLMVTASSGYACACDSKHKGPRCSTCKTCRAELGCGATPGSCIVYPDVTSTYASDTTSLNLADSNLVGELPDMSMLPNLVALDMSGNPQLKSGAVWGWVQTILDRGGTVKLSNTNRVVACNSGFEPDPSDEYRCFSTTTTATTTTTTTTTETTTTTTETTTTTATTTTTKTSTTTETTTTTTVDAEVCTVACSLCYAERRTLTRGNRRPQQDGFPQNV